MLYESSESPKWRKSETTTMKHRHAKTRLLSIWEESLHLDLLCLKNYAPNAQDSLNSNTPSPIIQR